MNRKSINHTSVNRRWSNRRRLSQTLAAFSLLAVTSLTGCGTAQNTTTGAVNNTTQGQSPAQNQTASSTNSTTPGPATSTQQWSAPPAMTIDTKKQYTAVVHTNYGDFEIQLFANLTPHTVNNFVFLAQHNFFNGDQFFRVIKTFMVQTGDPTNNGTGGPGYQFADELPPKYPYAPGIVAMANAGANTNGSQFFVCTGPDSTSLNQQPNYTEFGKIIKGMDVVNAIASIPVTTNPASGEQSLPTKTAYIESVSIVEK